MSFTFISNPNSLKLGLTGMLGSVALLLTGTTSAHAVNITATLTADNHYGLYYGQADGSGLTFVGRNEKGASGNPGEYNWSLPETFNFNANNGDYLYVLAWDDGFNQSWIGDFTLAGGGSLLSNTSDWVYKIASGANPGEFGDVPLLTTVAGEIGSATWKIPQVSAAQGTGPWGTIPGISSQAKFIWHDSLDYDSSSDRNYAIFRTKLALTSVPEPSTLSAIAVAGVMGWMIKRKQKASQAE
ncbi:MAG: PEP-CTERM sorting domain-containing protein [Nostoc sp.]|uniref:PEP-CTERM sorting domain-containing protein n=1 Tax=unclassified Nostoc TaxID=2593658 RepID=UPI0025E2EF13|nr:PEP-CTERM sorting domain-containing protein [Nostoc sp. JL33]MBN3872613.1 PEP-CTERM sorting domain-containing protein [Nostoc sp. JL33]